MKKLALVLMLLVLPSMAWANTSSLECSALGGTTEGDRYIETFVWQGEHKSWSAVEGWNTDEGWVVEGFSFREDGVIVNLRHVEQGRGKTIMFNNGWACRNIWIEEND